LPKYPGRNAEAWAVFNCEQQGGITWHKVNSGIDRGDILIQKAIVLPETITSIALLRRYAQISLDSFKEILPDLLIGTAKYTKQVNTDDVLYLSTMRPNDGQLNLEWTSDKMSAFLRAMDYGPLQTMGKPMINDYVINDYKIIEENNNVETTVLEALNKIVIRKKDKTFELTVEKRL